MKHRPKWMKAKGYVHITPSLNLEKNWKKYLYRIQDTEYIAKYAFYPLMHRIIKSRRYKKPNPNKHDTKKRAHHHKNKKTGEIEHSAKKRPLHYATHFDALIYAYYAEQLKDLYENKLKELPPLNQSVIAYRSIPVSSTDKSGKSNIHFAKEAFQEINRRVEQEKEIAVLTLDLKSFFSSLSHDYLYKVWTNLLGKEKLPPDHQNIFNACTDFSYILLDDLRKHPKKGFKETELAEIRKKHGYKSFFANNKDFRQAIREGELPIYKNPFRQPNRNGKKGMVGIPQGLPISAILANIYLLEFDTEIIQQFVLKEDIYYRRYSDDILIVCRPDKVKQIYQYIEELIKNYKVILSEEKTEHFLFRKVAYNKKGDKRITSIQLKDRQEIIGAPLTYLGFEFRGYNALIKSANLAKYYRRLIDIIKRRAKRARKLSQHAPTVPQAVYMNQIKKLYNTPLRYEKERENKQVFRTRYRLIVNERGDFEFDHFDIPGQNSNYISYIQRCDRIFETKAFSRQLKKKRKIIGQAIRKHLIDKD